MIKISIIRDSVVTNSASFPSQEEAQAWYDSHLAMGSFGSAESHLVEFVDITSQVEQEAINQQARQYLVDTDWYVIRSLEGTPVPSDILTERALARSRIT